MRRLSLDVFGMRLRERRKQLDMKQHTLAQQMGVAQGWISEIEHGRQTRLEADTVYRFAKALGCSADYLMGLSEAPQTAAVPPPATPPQRQRTRKATVGG